MLTDIPVEQVITIIRCAYENNHHRLCIETSLIWLESNDIFKENKIKRIDNPYICEIFEKLTVMCYYVTQYRDLGYFITEFLLLNAVNVNKEMIKHNRQFYSKKLNYVRSKNLDLNSYPLLFPKTVGETYKIINPSILKINEGYLINCRLINYLRPKEILWEILDIDNKIRSKNIILILDKEFNKINESELLDKSWRKNLDLSKSCFIGMEDLILFKHDDQLYCSFTSLDSEPISSVKQNIAKLNLYNDQYIIDDVKVMKIDFNIAEKNWLYINWNGKINFIHSHQPFGVKLINYSDSAITSDENIVNVQFSEINQGINFPGFKDFRGSAPPLEFSHDGIKGWLSIIHEVVKKRDTHGLCYLHRFIFYDKDLHVKYISNIFYFENIGIEFCRSMCYSHDETTIIIGVGIKDLYAKLFEIYIETIKSMLIPLENFKFID